MKNNMLSAVFFVLVFASPIYGQVPLTGVTYVKHFQQNINYTASPAGDAQDNQLVIRTSLGGVITWQYRIGAGAWNPVGGGVPLTGALTGMTLAPGAFANQVVVRGIPTNNTGDLLVTIMATSGASSQSRPFHFFPRKPNEIVFVLDRSGSMECPPGDWGWPCQAGTPRWDVLKSAINIFMYKLKTGVPAADSAHTVKGDRVSVVYFDGYAGYETGATDYSDRPPLDIDSPTADFASPETFKTGIGANMQAQEFIINSTERLGRTGTNIAGGLFNAVRNKFNFTGPDATRRRVVVLMTDGDQNTDFTVRETGGNAGREVYYQSGTPATVTTWNNTGGDNIECYTIGFGSLPPTHPNLMQNIANGDCHLTSNGTDYSYGVMLGVDVFNKIFKAYSPQTIRTVAYTNPPERFSETFVCNADVSRLFLEAYTDGILASGCSYTIWKDSVNVTDSVQSKTIGDYNALFVFDFNRLSTISSKGTWKIILEFPPFAYGSNQKYHVILSATADDHLYKFESKLDQTSYIVGDHLDVSARFAKMGIPIKNAQVTATILRPGDDWGDVIARAPNPEFSKDTSLELGSVAQQKYAYLDKNIPQIIQKLEVKNFNNVIPLSPDGNGNYTGSFGKLELSGVYQVLFKVSYYTPSDGKVERTIPQSLVVRFGELDMALATQTVEIGKGAEKGSVTTIRYTPAYRSGNRTLLVGPGFERAFEVVGTGAQLQSVKDNADGSYTLVIKGNTLDPKANVIFYGEKVYSGALARFGKPFLFNISLHAGVTQPFGKLDSLYNGGGFAEVDFGYQLTSKWSLEAVGGYYSFNPGFSIVGGTLYAKWDVLTNSNGWTGTLAAGAGVFKPENIGVQGGLSLRAGVQKMLTSRWSVGLEGAFFSLPKPDYTFGTLGLGVRYYF